MILAKMDHGASWYDAKYWCFNCKRLREHKFIKIDDYSFKIRCTDCINAEEYTIPDKSKHAWVVMVGITESDPRVPTLIEYISTFELI